MEITDHSERACEFVVRELESKAYKLMSEALGITDEPFVSFIYGSKGYVWQPTSFMDCFTKDNIS